MNGSESEWTRSWQACTLFFHKVEGDPQEWGENKVIGSLSLVGKMYAKGLVDCEVGSTEIVTSKE